MNRRTYSLLLAVLLLLFLVLAARYATGLQLWGDEAYTLALVSGDIPGPDPSHLPTYFVLVDWMLDFVPERAELTLRMLHAVAFAAGLLFGALFVRRLAGDRRLVLYVLGAAILLPEFHFYATNLRMYAFIFLASMAYIHALFGIVSPESRPGAGRLAWFAVSGSALVAIDYPGLVLFAAGAGFLLLQWTRRREWRLVPLLAIPVLPFLLFLIARPQMLTALFSWDMEGYQGVQWAGLFDALKWVYLSCRPALDLVYAAPLPTPVALGLPVFLFAAALWLGIRYVRDAQRPRSARMLAVLLAFYWILLIPSGFTFARLFLPSQFLMVFLLVHGVRSDRRVPRILAAFAIGLLVVVNLQQSLFPVYRLYSIIPYETIAMDAAQIAGQRNIPRLFASDNTLNTLSILRYAERKSDLDATALQRFGQDSLRGWAAAHPDEPFVFVAHMGEGGTFTDVTALHERTAERVRTYVSLDDLPYNAMWSRRYRERAFQQNAVEVWVVR